MNTFGFKIKKFSKLKSLNFEDFFLLLLDFSLVNHFKILSVERFQLSIRSRN